MADNYLGEIISHFSLESNPTFIAPLGNGLINDTYKVTTDGDAPDYVLQRINHHVFTNVDLLQHNIDIVTAHIRHKLEAKHTADIDRKVLRFLASDSGKSYYRAADGSYWRMSVFITHAVSYEEVNAPHAEACGKAFGEYEEMLSDLKEPLGETIPDFHNMEVKLQQFRQAIDRDAVHRYHEVEDMAQSLLSHGHEMCLGERLYREGRLPKRACHCDTKVNNMMFDATTGDFLLVIDLDTTMPSFVFSDYGDFMRTATNATAEDDADLSHVALKWDIIEAFTRGYLEGAGAFLTDVERENLPFAAALFPYMQSVRFLTDYLNGDHYWKVKYKTHNLDRARNQQRLYELMWEAQPRLRKLVC